MGMVLACSSITCPIMAFVSFPARGPAILSRGRKAVAPLAPTHHYGLPALYMHLGSEPPPPTLVEETSAILDIPAALISNNFPTPNSNSSLITAALRFLEGEPMDKQILKKWLNLVLLVAAGVYGTSLLVTVDMDNWRGWTLQEIMLRIPYDNWQEYEGGLSTHPILVKTIINVVIYIIGDWMSQVGWGRTKNLLDFDLARTARNGLIGAMFGPLVHYYYDFSDWLLPMDVPINRVYKLLMDQSIYFFVKCSAYIALVGLLRGDPPKEVVQDVKGRIWPVVFRGWRFWPVAHIVTYGFIPTRHRVLWVNMLDLLWSSILAQLASKEGGEELAAASVAVEISGAAPNALETSQTSASALPPSCSQVVPNASVTAYFAENRTEEDAARQEAIAATARDSMPSLLPITADELSSAPGLDVVNPHDGETGEEKGVNLLVQLGRKEAGGR